MFGIVFDALPPPELECEGASWGCGTGDLVDVMRRTYPRALSISTPRLPRRLPAASARSLAFTLWLKSADFRARCRGGCRGWCGRSWLDNPHTTLQVVLEPAGDPRHLTAEVLETLLAASHESLSYLDWFYSLHPVRLLGAKRLVVLLPAAMEESLDEAWLDEIEDRATIHWASKAFGDTTG